MNRKTTAAALANTYLDVMRVVSTVNGAAERLDESIDRLNAFANEIDTDSSDWVDAMEDRNRTLEIVDLLETLREKLENVADRIDRDALVEIRGAAVERNPNVDLRHFGR